MANAWEFLMGGIGALRGAGTSYLAPMGAVGAERATEAPIQIKVYDSFNATKLLVQVRSNSLVGVTTYTLMVNGIPSTLTLTVPAGTDGFFEDNHIVSLVPNDLIDIEVVRGAGAGTSRTYTTSICLIATKTSKTFHGCFQSGPLNGYAYFNMTGMGGAYGVPGLMQDRVRTPQTLSNFRVYVEANTALADSPCGVDLNGAPSTLIVSIPTGTTGAFEDTTHSVALVSGDLICFYLQVLGGGASIINATLLTCSTTSTHRYQGTSASGTYNINAANSYAPLESWFNDDVGMAIIETENKSRLKTMTYRYLFVRVNGNVSTDSVTVAFYVNGADSTLMTTIPAGTTGEFENLTHSVHIMSDDIRGLHHNRLAGGGNVGYSTWQVEETGTDPPYPVAGNVVVDQQIYHHVERMR